MLSINCTNKVTPEEFAALTQEERKRLGEIVKEKMSRDHHLSRDEAMQQAYHIVLAESVPFHP